MIGGVSVALCTYNGARFVVDQLRSILAQGHLLREIVVADDGSSDETLDLVRMVAEEAGGGGFGAVEIRILDSVGGHGVTKNFERAIAACRGDLIALSDQDDLWLPGRLALQLDQFEARPELTLLHGDACLVDESGHPLGSTLFETLEVDEATRRTIHDGGAFDVLLRRNIVTGATLVFRRSLLDVALPIPREWVHDEWLAIIAAATGRVDLIEQPVTDYRQHGANEIGVRAPTLRNKVNRVLQPRGTRNRDLAVRSRLLLERLESLSAATDAGVTDAGVTDAHTTDAASVAAVRGKSSFERFRAELSPHRLKRIVPVLRRARSGDYAAYASQGRTDILRDLLQPA